MFFQHERSKILKALFFKFSRSLFKSNFSKFHLKKELSISLIFISNVNLNLILMMQKVLQSILIASLFLAKLNSFGQTDLNIPYQSIAVYIDYPDYPATVTTNELDSILNGMDYQDVGVERTFRKYWYEQSRRNFDPHHEIFYYTAPQSYTYYQNDDVAAKNMWQDALESIITNNPNYDWSLLNHNMHGSHSSIVPMILSAKNAMIGVGAAHDTRWNLSNGEYIHSIYVAHLQSQWDVTKNLFTLIHESGHGIFGFPDTYDTDEGPEDSGGTSHYTLMSGLHVDVEPIGAPFQVEFNWGHVLEPTEGTTTITLRADGDSVVAFRNPYDPNEYFSIEARKNTTIGNSLFPANIGLLIWHTDNKVPTSNTLEDMTPTAHYRQSVEQADGLFELENFTNQSFSTDIGDIYLPGKEFTNVSIPNSKWWDGQSSGFSITNIQLIGTEHIQFTVQVAPQVHRYPELSKTNWSVDTATIAQSGYEAALAFDDDESTYYHVEWGTGANTKPHELVIDMGKSLMINEFNYTANDNFFGPWEGRVNSYELYLSDDPNNWGSPIHTGNFLNSRFPQYTLFSESPGRYLRFKILSTHGGGVRTSVAEISVNGYDPSTECPIGNNGDSDGDGTLDCFDDCPLDANKTQPGECGCGNTEESCTSTCENTPEWNASTVYSTAGTEVKYLGKLYSNKWYIQGTPPSSGGAWELIDFCDGTGMDCSNALTWNSSAAYSTPNTEVVHLGKLYTNQWYSQGQEPGTNAVWVLTGPCESSNSSRLSKERVDFELSPNPFMDHITIQHNLDNDYLVNIKVYNSVGVIIKNIESVSTNNSQINLDLSDLTAGTYILKLTNNVIQESFFIVKQ